MRLHVNADGTVAAATTAADDANPACRPPATPNHFEFDEETNPQLARAVVREMRRFTVINGQLLHDGAAVPVAPDGAAVRERRAVEMLRAKLFDSADPLSAAEVRAVLKWLVRRELAEIRGDAIGVAARTVGR